MDNTSHFDNLPLVLSVNDICKVLFIGKNSAYALISTGQLRHFRVGRQIRIPKSALLNYINQSHI